jgi:TolB-like protein
MTDQTKDLQDLSPSALPNERLSSWKEIAAYMNCSERTVRRWEQEGLPVLRQHHKKKDAIYAYKAEIDAWLREGHDRQTQIPESTQEAWAAAAPTRRPPWMAAKVALFALPALILIAILVGFNFGGMRAKLVGRPAAISIQSLAVLPLENLSHDPDQEYFSDGMTDALITDLARTGALKVISRTSSMQYKRPNKSLPEIARELNVDAIVEGTVQRSGDHVRITAQLILGTSDKHMWTQSYDRELRDALQMQQEIAQDIAQEISANLGSLTGSHHNSPYPLSTGAYENYLKGRNYVRSLHRDDLFKGGEFLERSIQQDPNFAPAYAELSYSYMVIAGRNLLPPEEALRRAKATVAKALALDENLAEAHCVLGMIQGEYEWDWPAEERELTRAVQLDPSSSLARMDYAIYLITMGRKKEAIQEVNTALELDPFSPMQHTLASWFFLLARQYELAIQEARRAIQIDPVQSGAQELLGMALAASGADGQAFTEWLQYLNLNGETDLAKDLENAAQKMAGTSDMGHKLARITLAFYRKKSKTQYVSALVMAAGYMDLGDRDKTFEWLNKAYQERSAGIYSIGLQPYFDPLRADPRFNELLRRMNLQP